MLCEKQWNFPGTATVTAIFEGQGKSEKQTQKVYLRRGDYKEVEFVFDISFWRNLFNPSTFFHIFHWKIKKDLNSCLLNY